MSMSPNGPYPKTPTMPRGNEIAVYSTYLKAQKAVDTLSDEGFEVQTVTIVGHDLHMVERVTGRLTYGRVAFAGFASGAWVGLFLGLMIMLFASDGGGTSLMLTAILFGGASGLLFSIVSYALTGGKRDFTSQSQVVAARYVLLCAPETAGKARSILAEKGVGSDLGATAGPRTVVAAPNPATSQAGGSSSAPQYGVRVDGGTSGQQVSGQPAANNADGSGQGANAQPLTYGEALDAQRRAAQQAPQYGARADSPAPAEVSGDSVSSTPEESNAPAESTQSPAPRELKNPDNPFSPPKD